MFVATAFAATVALPGGSGLAFAPTVLAADFGGWGQILLVIAIIVASIVANKRSEKGGEDETEPRPPRARRAPKRRADARGAPSARAQQPTRAVPQESEFAFVAPSLGASSTGDDGDTVFERPPNRPVRVASARRGGARLTGHDKRKVAADRLLPAFDGPEFIRAIVMAEVLNRPGGPHGRGPVR